MFTSLFNKLFGGNATDIQIGNQENYPYSIADTPISINEDTALKISTVYRCITLIATMLGSIPINVYKEVDGEQEKIKDDVWDLIHHRPNHTMSGQEFIETMILNLMLHGNFYARIARNGIGEPIALWPMPSQNVTPELLENGELVYNEAPPDKGAGTVVHKARNVLHIKDVGNGLVGLSRIAYAAQSIGIAASQEQYTADFFTSGGKPGAILKLDGILTPEQRKQLQENLSPILSANRGNAHSTVLLEGGMDFQQTQLSMSDLETLASRKFQREDIARWFGVPLALLGIAEHAGDRANAIEEVLRGWVMTDLGPLMTKITNSYQNQLLTTEQRKDTTIKFDFHEILRYDLTTQMTVAKEGVQNGLMTVNEGRKMMHLPLMEGEEYNQLRQQQQMQSMTGDTDEDTDPDDIV